MMFATITSPAENWEDGNDKYPDRKIIRFFSCSVQEQGVEGENQILRLLIHGLKPQEIPRWVVLATVPGEGMLPGVQVQLVQSFAGNRVFEQEVRIAGYGVRSLQLKVQLNGLSGRFDYSGVLQLNRPKGEPLPVFR